MYVSYEDAVFKIGIQGTLERNLVKQAVKKRIGRLIGKPYIADPYLKFAHQLLSDTPYSVIIDVGANIGTTVLPLAVKFPASKFYAIEPHPIPAARLIQNCEKNGVKNVSVLSTAIGLGTKMAQIYTCPTNSGGHRLTGFEGRKDLAHFPTFGPIAVPIKPLSHIFQEFEINVCDLLKIDTEGYEVFVLESLESYLHPSKIKYVIAELGLEGLRHAGKSAWDMVSLMLEKGYVCRVLGSDNLIQKEKDLPMLPDFCVTDLVFTSK